MITIEQMIQREVNCCVSSLVSTLASGHDLIDRVRGSHHRELGELAEQAFELASPVPDYQEAAEQANWQWDEGGPHFYNSSRGGFEPYDYFQPAKAEDWQALCEAHDIEPYEWEVYEHWAVSQWLAERLLAEGEKVDTDFAGLNVWARTCTGQAISMDGCIQRVYVALVQS